MCKVFSSTLAQLMYHKNTSFFPLFVHWITKGRICKTMCFGSTYTAESSKYFLRVGQCAKLCDVGNSCPILHMRLATSGNLLQAKQET